MKSVTTPAMALQHRCRRAKPDAAMTTLSPPETQEPRGQSRTRATSLLALFLCSSTCGARDSRRAQRRVQSPCKLLHQHPAHGEWTRCQGDANDTMLRGSARTSIHLSICPSKRGGRVVQPGASPEADRARSSGSPWSGGGRARGILPSARATGHSHTQVLGKGAQGAVKRPGLATLGTETPTV